MTEQQWLDAADPAPLLAALGGRATDRQLRLFGCACCRLVWDPLPFDECRRAVELAERYADNRVTAADLHAARRALNGLLAPEHGCRARLAQATARLLLPRFPPATAAWVGRMARTGNAGYRLAPQQADLLRDVIGPWPRRVPLRLRRPADGLLDLAQSIRERRAFDQLPALADLLIASGCDNEAALEHCRRPAPHTHGCWALDELLGEAN